MHNEIMNLKLRRSDFLMTGIFGELESDDESLLLQVLEHSYPIQEGGASFSTNWAPKVPPGQYTCVRGTHRLIHGAPFETFEVTNVPGHTGVLFHPGNTESDSEGCLLLGLSREKNIISHSLAAFEKFIECQIGCDSFMIDIS
jgi:hypothetical protein